MLIKEGNVDCSGASAGIVDIVAGGGDMTVTGSCKVDGNVWSPGAVTINGGTRVGGNVIAASVNATTPIGGSVWSSGNVRLSWGSSVGGTVSSKNLFAEGSTITGNVYADGTVETNQTNYKARLNATGDITATSGSYTTAINALGKLTLRQFSFSGAIVGKSLSLNNQAAMRGTADIYGPAAANDWGGNSVENITASSVADIRTNMGNSIIGSPRIRPAGTVPSSTLTQNPAMPARPTVPEWIDVDYVPGDWTGFTERVLQPNGCGYVALRDLLAATSGPILIDARACTNGLQIGGEDKLAMGRDIAIFANRFDLGGSGGFTSTSAARLWLIQPDTVKPTNGGKTRPDCANRSFGLGGGFSFSEPINTLIYTPCRMELASSTVLKGQIYAGRVTIAGGSQLKYVRVGLPGVDLDTGGTGPTTPVTPQPPTLVVTGTELGAVLDYRDVNGP